jgi:hypothetical protein
MITFSFAPVLFRFFLLLLPAPSCILCCLPCALLHHVFLPTQPLLFLTLGAKERLARLEAGGTRLPTFLSPRPGIGISGGSSPPSSPSLRGLGSAGADALVGGVSGESFLSGGSLAASLHSS